MLRWGKVMLVVAGCAGLWCVTAAASAGSPAPAQQGAQDSAVMGPCAPDSPGKRDAARRLAVLDVLLADLKPGDDHKLAAAALGELAGHRCMALAQVDPSSLRAESAEALVDFWKWGRSWIDSQLGMAPGRPLYMMPPMRKVLSPATRPAFPMPELLCEPTDVSCGRETAGWWQRAESFFELNARRPWRRPAGAPSVTEQTCAAEALLEPAGEQYRHWQLCVEELTSWGFVMPLGRLKAPTSGWLVVRGRRGHYSFCDEIRMYSLATGASYISQSCGELAIAAAPGAGRREALVRRGSTSLDNVREVAWVLLLLDEVVADFPWRQPGIRLPDGIEPALRRGTPVADEDRTRSGWVVVDSGQTTLAWTITTPAGEALAGGKLRWPGDRRGGAVDHAGLLLRVAEEGFIEGCPADAPPADIQLGGARPSVSALDASAAELQQAERELLARLHEVVRAPCGSASRQ